MCGAGRGPYENIRHSHAVVSRAIRVLQRKGQQSSPFTLHGLQWLLRLDLPYVSLQGEAGEERKGLGSGGWIAPSVTFTLAATGPPPPAPANALASIAM